MKKFVITGIFAFLIVFSCITSVVGANNEFSIKDVYIDAVIMENGDLVVTELFTYQFEGQFNGIIRLINTDGSDGIKDFQANVPTKSNNAPLLIEEDVEDSVHTFRIHEQSEDEIKLFRLSYTLTNAVTVYEDTADFFWKFFDDTNDSAMGNVTIDVRFETAPTFNNQVTSYATGPVHGKIISETEKITFQAGSLKRRELLEIRLLFPVEFVAQSNKIIKEKMYDTIVQQENEAVLLKEKQAEQKELFSKVGWGMIGFLVLFLIVILLKLWREEKLIKQRAEMEAGEWTTIPEDISPAVMSYLLTINLTQKDIIATLMDLVRKGKLSIEADNETFRIVDHNKNDLLSHEAFFIDWIFTKVGTNSQFHHQDVAEYTKKESQADQYYRDFAAWRKLVSERVKEQGYKQKNHRFRRNALLLGIPLFSYSIFHLFSDLLTGIILAFISFSICLVAFFNETYTATGYVKVAKWKSLKKYLQRLNSMNDLQQKNKGEFPLLLVYAISMGLADKFIKNIELKEARRQITDSSGFPIWVLYGNGSSYASTKESNHLLTNLESSFKTADTNVQSFQSSSSSSSSSSGGSGGGGGAGAF